MIRTTTASIDSMDRNRGGARRRNSCRRCRRGSRLRLENRKSPQDLQRRLPSPHLGGPLNKGIVVGATIRCPWHHACFDFETEEATAAPAFDALLEYPVTIDDNRFSAKPASAQIFRRIGRHEVSLGTMAIVGGGAAGFAAADAIRKIGWRGGVTIILGRSRAAL